MSIRKKVRASSGLEPAGRAAQNFARVRRPSLPSLTAGSQGNLRFRAHHLGSTAQGRASPEGAEPPRNALKSRTGASFAASPLCERGGPIPRLRRIGRADSESPPFPDGWIPRRTLGFAPTILVAPGSTAQGRASPEGVLTHEPPGLIFPRGPPSQRLKVETAATNRGVDSLHPALRPNLANEAARPIPRSATSSLVAGSCADSRIAWRPDSRV